MTDPVALHIQDATRAARLALSCLHRLLPPPNLRQRLTDTGGKGCPSCARILSHDGQRPWFSDTRTPKSTHCRNCEDWQRARGKLPPPGVLELWRDGIRQTTTRVARAEADERAVAAKRKRKRAS